MGTDIHSVGQVKINGKWVTLLQDVAGDNRNYDTFAQLADVRNGRGFAGTPTGGGFAPITYPKGLPEDFETVNGDHHIDANIPTGEDFSWADVDYLEKREKEKLMAKDVYMGDHSFSWHLLSDLKAYAKKVKSKGTTKTGCISEEEYKKIRSTGGWPDLWSGASFGPNQVTIDMDEYDRLEKLGELPKKQINVQYTWKINYLDTGYLPKIISELEQLGKKHGAKSDDDVRYVFGFDS